MTGKKLGAAAIGGGASAVASQIPGLQLLNLACCALVVGGGVLAVYLALKDDPPSATAPYLEGAKIGTVAGVVASILSILVGFLILGGVTGLMGLGALSDASPEDLEALSFIGAIAGLGAIALIVFSLVINVVFSVVGGVIGAAVVHKKLSA